MPIWLIPTRDIDPLPANRTELDLENDRLKVEVAALRELSDMLIEDISDIVGVPKEDVRRGMLRRLAV